MYLASFSALVLVAQRGQGEQWAKFEETIPLHENLYLKHKENVLSKILKWKLTFKGKNPESWKNKGGELEKM